MYDKNSLVDLDIPKLNFNISNVKCIKTMCS